MLHHQQTALSERPAAIGTLSKPMRAATLAAAAARLKRCARGWHVEGHPAPISHRTVQSMHARGLLIIGRRVARLSETGKWYARTLARSTAQEIAP